MVFQEISEKIHGRFKSVERKFQGYFKIVTKVFQGRLREISVGVKVILKNFKGSFSFKKEVSRVFQEIF